MSDPIRARLDDPRPATAPTKYELWAALRAVLDLCDREERRYGTADWTWDTDIRRVIAEHLGVTDG